MKFIKKILVYFLFEVCFAGSTISNAQRNPFKEKVEGLFELLGYSTSCASATLTACKTECPHNFQSTIWKAKRAVDSAALELNNAIFQLANAVNCLPDPDLKGSLEDGLESLSHIRQEKLVWETPAPSATTESTTTTTQRSITNFYPMDCVEILENGFNISGVYDIYPYPEFPKESEMVFCDQETDGGGWIVLQRRQNQHPRENFNREWNDYVYGFGNLSGEFWLGLDLIHYLTKSNFTEVRIDMEDAEGKKRYAKYKDFTVGNLTSKYIMDLGNYSGNAGDSLAFHKGNEFTTYDQDNDNYKMSNCAKQNNGGWWFNSCLHSNLNGYQFVGKARHAKGIVWFTWHGYSYSLTGTAMKIRRTFRTDQYERKNQPATENSHEKLP